MGSEWCLAALPAGFSWIAYQWVIWKFQKEMTTAVGQNLLEGEKLIGKRISHLPPAREPAPVFKLLRLAIPGGRKPEHPR